MISQKDQLTIELFETTARALCPTVSWKADIADLMSVRRDTVRFWLNGRMELRLEHFASLLELVRKQRAELLETDIKLQTWLDNQGYEE